MADSLYLSSGHLEFVSLRISDERGLAYVKHEGKVVYDRDNKKIDVNDANAVLSQIYYEQDLLRSRFALPKPNMEWVHLFFADERGELAYEERNGKIVYASNADSILSKISYEQNVLCSLFSDAAAHGKDVLLSSTDKK